MPPKEPGGWYRKHRILAAQYPYAIADHITTNNVAALHKIMVGYYAPTGMVTKNSHVTNVKVDDTITAENQ